MQKILFLDRDGTIIVEPLPDRQIDRLEKLEFLPGAITNLARIAREMDYALVLVTNQDGLGTASFPEAGFWRAHEKMIKTLENEGVRFQSVHIDRSFAHENQAGRKPGTAMLTGYMNGGTDLAGSYVVGDRLTDVQLAHNLGAGAILLLNREALNANVDSTQYDPAGSGLEIDLIAADWTAIYQYLKTQNRPQRPRQP